MIGLIFCLGATNGGKTTFMDKVATAPLDLIQGEVKNLLKIGLVQVGKILRAKYPPSHFEGQANPQKTAQEAWDLMVEGIENCQSDDFVFVDGQPRDLKQHEQIITKILPKYSFEFRYLHLYASDEIRLARAQRRDTDPEKLKLSMQRMVNDIPPLYAILSEIQATVPFRLRTVKVDDNFDPVAYFQSYISKEFYKYAVPRL